MPAKSTPAIIGKRRTTGALPVTREAVLVIHRRPFDRDGDVAVHQILFVEIGKPHRLAVLGLIDDDRLECRHAASNQAGTAARRATGFSTIGMLISAESTPNRIASHHTGLYEPVRSNTMPPSQTPRKPPTWWLKKAKPASVASQRVPNISAMMPLVGGTVDSHIRPMVAPKIDAGERRDRKRDERQDRRRADEIDEREQITLRHAVAEPAGGDRTDDVEQPDRRQRPAADLRRQAAIDQIRRHVHGDERKLESAGEKAEHQQHVGAMGESFADAPAAAIAAPASLVAAAVGVDQRQR